MKATNGAIPMSRLLAICLLLWGTVAAQATDTSTFASRDDLNAFKELQQSKLESQKELQVKDMEAVRQQITAVDKRVDDQLAQIGQSIDRFGIVATLLSIGITILLVLGGFLGYRNARSEAKDAASDAAGASAKEWFDKQANQLRETIEAMEQKAARLHAEMDEHAQGVQAHAADVAKALNTAQESIGKTGTQIPSALDESTKVLAQRDRELKASNEDSYSFDDWNTRAHAAYASGALEDAAYFWLKASRVANVGAASVAKVLVNRGITQGQLSQNEAAMATYDEVLRRFGEAAEPALRESVARALINKGISQGRLNQDEAAMDTYEEVLRRFGDSVEPVLRESVARALINKANTQCRLNQNEAALATYDEVQRLFGDSAEPALQKQVAIALVNKGNTQGQLN
ncbi:MAG: tetratricopeptide repeat protein [Acidovorax sp.]|uniref:tetratricopeptide repeat protein n=1 Tax=Acidovorax sp. TaxID=1872122 RepID=UPI0025BED875|nr:tetratricopeptide repeat protein [Acidovorax sp.]MCE1194473.1 tetratricopeptide repeat protein [Acidovorax sp.]